VEHIQAEGVGVAVVYRIDKLDGIVHTEASGTLTDPDVREYQHRLKADTNFDPAYREFFNLSEVNDFRLTLMGIRIWAANSPWGDSTQRAFVARSDLVYGMLRMHQSLLDLSPQEVAVFRTVGEAWSWLGQTEELPESGSPSA
jgi:hypothetical protein